MDKQKIIISGNVVSLKIKGEITDRKSEQISLILQQAIADSGRINLFLVIEHYPTLDSAESLYEDLRFAKLHSDHIDRMAVIGDKSWKRTWVAIFGLFGGIQAEYFDRSEFKMAWEWVTAG